MLYIEMGKRERKRGIVQKKEVGREGERGIG